MGAASTCLSVIVSDVHAESRSLANNQQNLRKYSILPTAFIILMRSEPISTLRSFHAKNGKYFRNVHDFVKYLRAVAQVRTVSCESALLLQRSSSSPVVGMERGRKIIEPRKFYRNRLQTI